MIADLHSSFEKLEIPEKKVSHSVLFSGFAKAQWIITIFNRVICQWRGYRRDFEILLLLLLLVVVVVVLGSPTV